MSGDREAYEARRAREAMDECGRRAQRQLESTMGDTLKWGADREEEIRARERKPTSPADMTDAGLSAAVAREVMGWPLGGEIYPNIIIEPIDHAVLLQRSLHYGRRDWLPVIDIAAAMGDVVREMRSRPPHGWRFSLSDNDDHAVARFWQRTKIHRARAPFGREARAICEAALAAVRNL